MDKVTRQCPQTTTFLKKKESRSGMEPRGPSAYQPNALPLGQTGGPGPILSLVVRTVCVDVTLAECCFTSTETVGLLGTGAQDGHSTFTQFLLSSVDVKQH